jgi:hypothetical protein
MPFIEVVEVVEVVKVIKVVNEVRMFQDPGGSGVTSTPWTTSTPSTTSSHALTSVTNATMFRLSGRSRVLGAASRK